MTEQTIGQSLEQDHHVIDEHFAAFAHSLETDSPGTPGIDTASLEIGVRALKHHIYVEEVFHFPPLRAGGLMGPIMVMLREHGELWDLLGRLEAQVAEGAPVAEISQTWHQVETTLAAHNTKEEQIVYPGGDAILDAETSAEIRGALTADDAPHGWVCQMAGRTPDTPS